METLGFFSDSSNLNSQTNLGGPNFKELLHKGNHLVVRGLKHYFPGTQLKGNALCLVFQRGITTSILHNLASRTTFSLAVIRMESQVYFFPR